MKPKEFWLQPCSGCPQLEAIGINESSRIDALHVIEYSAFEKQGQQLAKCNQNFQAVVSERDELKKRVDFLEERYLHAEMENIKHDL